MRVKRKFIGQYKFENLKSKSHCRVILLLSVGKAGVIMEKIFHFDMWKVDRHFEIFVYLKVLIYMTTLVV
jgi:hypothetical protein